MGLPDLQIEEIGMRVGATVPLSEQSNIQSLSPEVTDQVMDQVGTKFSNR